MIKIGTAGTYGEQSLGAHSANMKAVSCGIPSGYTPLFPFCMSGQWYAVAGITGWNSSTGSVNVVVYNTFSSAQNCSAQAWLLCVRNKK